MGGIMYLCTKNICLMNRIVELKLDMFSRIGNAIMLGNGLLLADNVTSTTDRTHVNKHLNPEFSVQVDFTMVLLCLRGEIKFLLNGQEVCLRSNEVIVIKNNDIATFLDISEDYELLVIGYSSHEYFENLYNSSVMEQRRFWLFNNKLALLQQDIQRFKTLYNMMRDILADDNFEHKKEFVAKCFSLMIIAFHDVIERTLQEGLTMHNQRDNLIFEKFLLLLKGNLHEHHSLSFYADKLCLSPKYMSQIIQKVSGHFASEWITQYLVDEAKTLLLDGHHSSTQVADELGFPSASYFLRFFKRETGMTPMQFQRF